MLRPIGKYWGKVKTELEASSGLAFVTSTPVHTVLKGEEHRVGEELLLMLAEVQGRPADLTSVLGRDRANSHFFITSSRYS